MCDTSRRLISRDYNNLKNLGVRKIAEMKNSLAGISSRVHALNSSCSKISLQGEIYDKKLLHFVVPVTFHIE